MDIFSWTLNWSQLRPRLQGDGVVGCITLTRHMTEFSASYCLRSDISSTSWYNNVSFMSFYYSISYRKGRAIDPVAASKYGRTWQYTVWRIATAVVSPSRQGKSRRKTNDQTDHRLVLLGILGQNRWYALIRWLPLQHRLTHLDSRFKDHLLRKYTQVNNGIFIMSMQ